MIPRLALWVRLAAWASAVSLSATILLVLTRIGVPESNILPGPLWLVRNAADRPSGILITCVLLPSIWIGLVRPSRVAVVISVLATILWIAIGVLLGSIAAC